MAGLARRLAPAAALGGIAVVIVGVADPALAGRTDSTITGSETVATSTSGSTSEQPTDSATTSDTSSSGTSSCANGETVTGDAYTTPWGPVQVQATVADGQVCAVQAVAYPNNDRKSQMINAYAIPQLDAAASASPTAFDYVSGATYTSNGYHLSLQSILDSL